MRSGSAASASRSRTGVTDYPRGNRSRPTLPNNVRCWEQSGKHLLAVRISHIDPKETLTPRFDRPLRLARDQDGSVFRAQPRFDALDQPLPQ
jgi:hypothetical protein